MRNWSNGNGGRLQATTGCAIERAEETTAAKIPSNCIRKPSRAQTSLRLLSYCGEGRHTGKSASDNDRSSNRVTGRIVTARNRGTRADLQKIPQRRQPNLHEERFPLSCRCSSYSAGHADWLFSVAEAAATFECVCQRLQVGPTQRSCHLHQTHQVGRVLVPESPRNDRTPQSRQVNRQLKM